MGRLPLHRLPRRRRGGAGQPQREAPDALLPRARRGTPRASCRTGCVLDGEIVIAGPGGLEFDALSQRIHPAEKRIRQLAESTPASFVAFDLLAEGDRSFMEAPYAERRAALEKALKKARPPVHLTPVTDDPDVAADWFSRFEGAGLDGVVVKEGSLRVPARQAGDGQGQAPAHGRLRGRGLPHPQGRRRCGLAAPGPVRPLRDAAPRRRGLGVQRGPPARAGGRARALPEERAEGPPVGGVGRGPGRRPGARWDEPLERRQGHDLGAGSARSGVRGLLRPPAAGPLPARHVLRALAPRPRPGVVHVRAARHPGAAWS